MKPELILIIQEAEDKRYKPISFRFLKKYHPLSNNELNDIRNNLDTIPTEWYNEITGVWCNSSIWSS